MRLRHIAFLVLATVAFAATGCGGGDGDDVPPDAVAVVDGREVSNADFERLIDQAKRNYKQTKRPFPKAGTPEYLSVRNDAVQFLVEALYFELSAEDMGIEIGDGAVDAKLADLKKRQFQGNEKRYRAALEQAGMDEAAVRERLRTQLVQERIAEQVAKEIEVSDDEIEKYYGEHRSEYRSPASREVRHILVSVCGGPTAAKDCLPTGQARRLAERIRARIRGGERFEKLAKRYSDDPGSKKSGGKLTVSKGTTVPEFDKTAFELKTGVLSQPVKTDFGFHLIEALSAVKPAKTSPIAAVRAQIRSQIVAQKRSEALSNWVQETKKTYGEKTDYQVGFAPPSTVTQTTVSQ